MEFDLDFIRDNKDYSSMYRDDEYRRRFWNAIQSFTSEQRTRYLRYISGRTRIPYEPRYSENKHKVYLIDAYRYTDHNTAVPDVYTYNFHIYMLRYTTNKTWKQKIFKVLKHPKSTTYTLNQNT